MKASAIVDIKGTQGATFIGLLFSFTLLGMTAIQGNGRKTDPMGLKVFVAIIMNNGSISTLDALHTILCAYSIYWYLILNFGNVEALEFDMWAVNVQDEINSIIGYSVQLYYARRVYILSRNIFLSVLISVLGLLYFAITIKSFSLKVYSRFNTMNWMATVGLGGGALADILIAGSMCWYLYHKRTAYAKTNSTIMTLMSFSINSGLLTSILATLSLVFFVIASDTSLVWEGFAWTLCKCYVNSLLAMLNSRDYIRDRSHNATHNTTSNDTYALSSVRQSKAQYKSDKSGSTTVTINVHQATTTDYLAEKSDCDMEPSSLELGKQCKSAECLESSQEHEKDSNDAAAAAAAATTVAAVTSIAAIAAVAAVAVIAVVVTAVLMSRSRDASQMLPQ
ncbi:hypothetical protein BC827DRAFT_1271889 [Russula dissimulans]|nr:hypothetical protein BC827DRAFT_1271889 [Russula dissimulans]